MTLDVRYHPAALAELRADLAWYEERGTGHGDRFEMSVDDAVDSVLEWLEAGVVWPGWDSIPVVRPSSGGRLPVPARLSASA
ncbi:hypothetical protein BN12_790027 [Nostocoides japonicum T1-X7]|uniref:Uncharacterized protein n=1 Tax=Nostocoides japonicum T1-X7 TaxID=1194083 RepID=A0A077M1M4_9MICO|nr:hypothetical protein BN12_790027 [Tetrasphaera japonica T1-X7]